MAYDKKRDDGWFTWALIVFLFMTEVLAPLGLVLLLIKIFGNDKRPRRTNLPPQGKPIEARGTVAGGAVKQVQPVRPPQSGRSASRAQSAVRKAMKSPVPKKVNAILLKLGGVALLLMGVLIAGEALEDAIWCFANRTAEEGMGFGWLTEFLHSLTFGIGGGVLLGAGISMGRGLRRYAKYLSVMGDRDTMPVNELARTLGYPERRVEKDLQKMIDKGYFGGKAYLNVEFGQLFRSDEAAERFRRVRTAMGAEDRTPKEVEEGYSGILRNIRRANDAIADPVLSAKIDRLEEIAGKIFLAVEEDPQKRGKIDTFLNYYLPTTQKLLDSYAEFEAAGVEGENLRQAKQRIETTMDTIVRGFEHQLDELYQTDALDVDSDIRVLETMLRWDTASAAQDFGAAPPEKDAEER